jgi:LysM repeat protein
MRARLIVMSLLVVAALAAAPAALASGRNAQTAGLQVALRAQGLYRGSIDAIAGPGTVAAVRTFQRSHGLRVTGLADARTRRALGPLGRPLFGARQLRRGAFGWDVAVLQFLLVRQGIGVPINAYFDGPTAHGVKLLQRRLHLRHDGVVGPHTLTAIVRRNPVPLAQGAVTVATHVTHRTKHHSTTRIHVVRAGESLSSLARRYHTTVAKLARLNHLDPSHVLLIGTKLRIPPGARARVRITSRRRELPTAPPASHPFARSSTAGRCTTA